MRRNNSPDSACAANMGKCWSLKFKPGTRHQVNSSSLEVRCTAPMRRNNSPDSAWRTQNSDFGSGSRYIVMLIDG